jgi:hypothetical protein
MTIDRQSYRRLCVAAVWAFAVAAVALWVPLTWQTDPNQAGMHVLHVDFGALKPFRATWQSSANGFWLDISDVRAVALALSAVLTAAAVIAARTTYRCSHTPA